MPFGDYMAHMERHYTQLAAHRRNGRHIDPIYCPDCCLLMRRASDRMRYLGKCLLKPGGTVTPAMEEVFRQQPIFRLELNEDRTIRRLVNTETLGEIRPIPDGESWEAHAPPETTAPPGPG